MHRQMSTNSRLVAPALRTDAAATGHAPQRHSPLLAPACSVNIPNPEQRSSRESIPFVAACVCVRVREDACGIELTQEPSKQHRGRARHAAQHTDSPALGLHLRVQVRTLLFQAIVWRPVRFTCAARRVRARPHPPTGSSRRRQNGRLAQVASEIRRRTVVDAEDGLVRRVIILDVVQAPRVLGSRRADAAHEQSEGKITAPRTQTPASRAAGGWWRPTTAAGAVLVRSAPCPRHAAADRDKRRGLRRNAPHAGCGRARQKEGE